MSYTPREHLKRQSVILEGISQDLKYKEIASQLGVNRWVILNDLKIMRKNRDPRLEEAKKTQAEMRKKKKSGPNHYERFLNMTGMSFQEKTFRNMIDFYKPELMKILKSKNQYKEIASLPKSVRKTLKNNDIITKGWHRCELTTHAIDYLQK
jgi:hypothetical protein